jgi:hypothetical protein
MGRAMGLLVRTATGERCLLEAEHLIGRSPRAALRLDDSFVSTQHASIRWLGDGWELKDLGSRNGTAVDRVPVQYGQLVKLRAGMRVSFGNADQTWELADDSPPRANVTLVDGRGEPTFIDGDVLALPSQGDVQATLIRAMDGSWTLEKDDTALALTSGQTFEVGGKSYRLSTPGIVSDTAALSTPELAAKAFRLQHVRLEFRVSQDEEHVEIHVDRGGETVDLGSRSHNYMLLLLARERLAEAARGIADSACGWMDQEQLLRALRSRAERLNIDIFRIRKQFGAIGILDAASIVERRPGTKQLRIGVGAITISGV